MPVTVGENTIVCSEATVTGEVKLGGDCVVHPCAVICAELGPIIIGNGNLIEENVVIRNTTSEPLVIGDHNVFEVGSSIDAAAIGTRNLFEVRCRVEAGVTVGNSCVVGSCVHLSIPQSIPDKTIIQTGNSARRTAVDEPQLPLAQMDVLRKLLPNFHTLANFK